MAKKLVFIRICLKFLMVAVVIIPFLASCSADDYTNSDTYPLTFSVDLSEVASDLDSLVKKARIIPLEVNDQAVIAGIDRMIKNGDDLILYDSRGKQVLVYDTLGRHTLTINRIGNGPGEYRFLQDIIFDEETDLIGLLRQETGEVLWYDMQGDFQGSDRIDRDRFILEKAMIHGDRIYHFNMNPGRPSHKQVNVTDIHSNHITKSLIPTNVEQISVGDTFFSLGTFDNEVTFRTPYSQHLDIISSDTISRIIELNFGDHNMPSELKEEYLSKENSQSVQDRTEVHKKILDYALVKNIIPISEKIFVGFNFQYQPLGAVIDINTSEFQVFRRNFKTVPIGQLVGYDQNALYFEISTDFLEKGIYKFEEDFSVVENIEEVKTELHNSSSQYNSWILKLSL